MKLKDTLAAKVRENLSKGGGDQKSGSTKLSKAISPVNTRAEIAKAAGVSRDPIVVWNGVIVDGHNRFEICTRNGIAFEKINKRFENRAEAVAWIIRNQFGRRNLSAAARTLLALKLEESIKARAADSYKENVGRPPNKSEQNSASINFPAPDHIKTREELAKLAGVSRDTVDKVRKVEKHGTPEVKQAMRNG